MTARSSRQAFQDGFLLAHRRLDRIFIDLLWRGIWLVSCVVGVAGLVGWFGAQLGSLEWQGPDLTVPRPIILLYAARQLWASQSALFLLLVMAAAALATVWWLVLEARFRGGRENFWVFIGSSALRLTIIATATFFLSFMGFRDNSRWDLLMVMVILSGIALMVVIAETLIRCDAVELWATDLLPVIAVIGIPFVFEVFSLVLLTVGSAGLILSSSRLLEFALALAASGLALGLWSLFHSYLLVVRFSTVDIMRRNLEENVRGL